MLSLLWVLFKVKFWDGKLEKNHCVLSPNHHLYFIQELFWIISYYDFSLKKKLIKNHKNPFKKTLVLKGGGNSVLSIKKDPVIKKQKF